MPRWRRQRIIVADPEVMREHVRIADHRDRSIREQLIGMDVAAVGRAAKPLGKPSRGSSQFELRAQLSAVVEPEQPHVHETPLSPELVF
jgi:hypothetical protein